MWCIYKSQQPLWRIHASYNVASDQMYSKICKDKYQPQKVEEGYKPEYKFYIIWDTSVHNIYAVTGKKNEYFLDIKQHGYMGVCLMNQVD